MRNRKLTFALLAVIAAMLIVAVTPRSARADASCTTFLATKAAQAKGQWYHIELTMHREDVKLVSYSYGFLAVNADGSFTGRSNQLFSDRLAAQQPFNIMAADNLDLKLSQTGVLGIPYSPWNFNTTW